MTGLLHTSPVKLTILGYLPARSVPMYLRIGPPYALAGADSLRTCAAIAALAVGLEKQSQVAVATLVKTKDADPILVGLFPYNSQNEPLPRHLCMMQLPFRGDVINLEMDPLPKPEQDPSSEKRRAADNLIESMILPAEVLDHTRIPNPCLRSFHQSVVQRILEPTCPVVSVRTEKHDPMAIPPEVLEKARPAVKAFEAAFPLSKPKVQAEVPRGRKARGKKEGKTYRDYLDE
jgi:Ku70/Ku80 beta-barrel domain